MDDKTFFVEVLKYTSPIVVAVIGCIVKRKNAHKRRSNRHKREG